MTRRDLVLNHLPLVRAIAARMKAGHQFGPTLDDLVGWGTLGLIEAAERFREDGGASFETFSFLRIRGAMVDGLRESYGAVRQTTGAPAVVTVSYDPARDDRMDDRPTSFAQVETEEEIQRLREAIAELPPRERALVEAIDLRGRKLETVGRELGVTKSCVSKRRKVALGMLRERLQ